MNIERTWGEEGRSWAGDRGVTSKTVVKEEEVRRNAKISLFSKEYRNSRYSQSFHVSGLPKRGVAAHNVICLRLSVVTLCTCLSLGQTFVVSEIVTYSGVGTNGISYWDGILNRMV